jgi:hypothetical protein
VPPAGWVTSGGSKRCFSPWRGLHRQALMTCIACASLQHLRLAEHRRASREEMPTLMPGPPPSPSLPTMRRAILDRLSNHLLAPVRCPHCRRRFLRPPTKVPK